MHLTTQRDGFLIDNFYSLRSAKGEVEMPVKKIVASININKLPATEPEILQSLFQIEIVGSDSPQIATNVIPEDSMKLMELTNFNIILEK